MADRNRWQNRAGAIWLILVLVGGPMGCTGIKGSGGDAVQDCLGAAQARLAQAAAWECLPTLDGQCVPLEPFFGACAALWPECVLYPKFYLWESEVRAVTSHPPRGPVSHRVRLYHNILHTCRPAYRDPLRTHGDVAEFYDEDGRFMGLAVYMGQGLYCPLPAPGRRMRLDTREPAR
jgi:hypothetical protein